MRVLTERQRPDDDRDTAPVRADDLRVADADLPGMPLLEHAEEPVGTLEGGMDELADVVDPQAAEVDRLSGPEGGRIEPHALDVQRIDADAPLQERQRRQPDIDRVSRPRPSDAYCGR